MSAVVIAGDTSGSVTLNAPAVAGSTTLNLPTVSGGTLVTSDSSGNVGIGTTSPESALHVRSSNGRIIANASSATGNPSLLLRTSSAGNRDWEVYQRYTDGSFGIYDGVGGFDRLSITTSGNLLFNSGYGSVATAYGCRAWVNFNGTGTVAIRTSGNVSSITDNGTGDYTINFTTAMPDVNYAISGLANRNTTGGYGQYICTPYNQAQTSSTFRIAVVAYDGNFYDCPQVTLMVLR
jgi:hypothetical protein